MSNLSRPKCCLPVVRLINPLPTMNCPHRPLLQCGIFFHPLYLVPFISFLIFCCSPSPLQLVLQDVVVAVPALTHFIFGRHRRRPSRVIQRDQRPQ